MLDESLLIFFFQHVRSPLHARIAAAGFADSNDKAQTGPPGGCAVPMAEICSFIVIVAKKFDWQSIDIFTYIRNRQVIRPI